jgi:membrane protease YdiL (CAAX protease family)
LPLQARYRETSFFGPTPDIFLPFPGLYRLQGLTYGFFGVTWMVGEALHQPQPLEKSSSAPLPHISPFTLYTLLFAAAPIAGIIEESAFRGYMQQPIEQQLGLGVAILITGTMFAVAHLDFTWVLWPYYVAVAAAYGILKEQLIVSKQQGRGLEKNMFC